MLIIYFSSKLQVESVAKKLEKPLICVDTENANQTHEVDFCDSGKSNSSHNLIFNEEIYPKDYPVMMLYLPGKFLKISILYQSIISDSVRQLHFLSEHCPLSCLK